VSLALPIQWVHESPELLLRMAELKASYPLSLADAWIAASALEANAILVHKDPEFDAVPVAQEPLPYERAR
jgi:predicted nucleic acid-binding protein